MGEYEAEKRKVMQRKYRAKRAKRLDEQFYMSQDVETETDDDWN